MIDYSDEGEEISPGAHGFEPTPAGLAHWLEEQYAGDDRFESVEVAEPGPLDGEDVRVQFICNAHTHFLVSVLSEDGFIRIGLATESKDTVERIEEAVDEAGGSLTDFLSDALDSDEDLEHEVQHFHDDMDYFASDIPYQREEDLAADVIRDEVIYYLDGYMRAFEEYVG
ncbi:hypothetical protein LLG95_02420 [bacterium]|nr:hypothetical protein [bacterium]